MKFSKVEVTDLLKSWILISLAFAFVMGGFESLFISVLISLFTVGIGFLLHELAHKYVAQHYRYWAEYRANNMMLLLMFVTSFFGFLLAAPGAVWIHGVIDSRRNGIISAAGPFTNIILALIFLAANIYYPSSFFEYGLNINGFLALFNMLPFYPIDGSKIIKWNKAIYGTLLVVSLILTFIGNFI